MRDKGLFDFGNVRFFGVGVDWVRCPEVMQEFVDDERLGAEFIEEFEGEAIGWTDPTCDTGCVFLFHLSTIMQFHQHLDCALSKSKGVRKVTLTEEELRD